MKFFSLPPRPWAINIITLGWFIITTFYATRFIVTLLQWDFLLKVYYPYAPLYLCVSGIIWGTTGISLIFGLWNAKKWILSTIRITAVIFFISNIFEWIAILILSNWNKSEFIYPIVGIIFSGYTFYATNLPGVISFMTKGTFYVKRQSRTGS